MNICFSDILKVLFVGIIVSGVIFASLEKDIENLTCDSDSNCVKVLTTCCPCNNGGVEVCAPAHNASLYVPVCSPLEDIFCPTLYNCKIESCSCKNGNCEPILKDDGFF